MKIPRSTRSSNPAALANAVGIALVAGLAFAAPVAAQEQTAEQLDTMEQDVTPRMIVDTDALRYDVPPAEASDKQRWRHLDADGDGRISRSEGSADTDFDSNFEMVDVDSDGYINQTELDEHDPMEELEPEEEDER